MQVTGATAGGIRAWLLGVVGAAAVLGIVFGPGGVLSAGVRPVVKLALVAPFEGPERTMAYDTLFAARLAVRRRNEADSDGSGRWRRVPRALVEVVALNDNGDPGESMQQARELAVDSDVIGVVGPWSDETARAAIAVYREAGLAVVLPEAGDATLTADDPNDGIVRLSADNAEIARVAVDRVSDLGATRVALVRGDADLGSRFAAARARAALHTVADVELPADSSLPAGLLSSHPDAVLFAGDAFEAAELLTALRAQRVDALLVGGPALDRLVLQQLAGPAAENALVVAVAPAPEEPDLEEFVTAFRAVSGRSPSAQAILTYDAVNSLLAAADEGSAPATRASVFRGLKQVDINGMTGRIHFNERGGRIDSPVWPRPPSSP